MRAAFNLLADECALPLVTLHRRRKCRRLAYCVLQSHTKQPCCTFVAFVSFSILCHRRRYQRPFHTPQTGTRIETGKEKHMMATKAPSPPKTNTMVGFWINRRLLDLLCGAPFLQRLLLPRRKGTTTENNDRHAQLVLNPWVDTVHSCQCIVPEILETGRLFSNRHINRWQSPT